MFHSHSFHVNEAIKTTFGSRLDLKNINKVAKNKKKNSWNFKISIHEGNFNT